jgi:putative redox protein
MKVTLELLEGMKLKATDANDLVTYFDASASAGGSGSVSTPLIVFLESMAACSTMDVVSIVRKKRKTIGSLKVHVEAERSEEHPKVITKAKLVYELVSPDAEVEDLERAVDLSQNKYCSASAMFQAAGCEITTESVVLRP